VSVQLHRPLRGHRRILLSAGNCRDLIPEGEKTQSMLEKKNGEHEKPESQEVGGDELEDVSAGAGRLPAPGAETDATRSASAI